MISTFVSHLSKNFLRSSSFGKEIAMQIVLGFIALLIIGYSLAVGFALELIIVKGLKQSDPIVFLNGLLVYYFIGEFVMRYFMQSAPSWDVLAYLHLPISRSKIVNFLLCRSTLHLINVFVFLLFTPFALSSIANAYGISHGWVWLLSLWLISMMNHFIVLVLKKNLALNIWGLLVFIVIGVTLASSDYFGWYRLSEVSEKLFSTTLQGYAGIGILFLAVVLLYVGAFRFFKKRLYAEELSENETQTFRSAEWAFLQKFGLTGAWAKIELKLIFRNKRSREVFFMNIVFFFQALILYYSVHNPKSFGVFLFYGMICSGFFALYYGQFLFSWQSKHFDFTLTQPTAIHRFVESKYWLLTSITALWFLFSIPFVFLGWHILLVNLVCTLYYIGINIFMIMNLAMWGARSIDLKHSGSLNYEGMGAAQWVMSIPVLASPYIFYLPFSLMGYPIVGLVSVGVAGLIGIVFHRKLIGFTSRRLLTMRYVMASNFRKD